MLKQRPYSYLYLFKASKPVTTCAVPIEPPSVSATSIVDEHKTLCFSLVQQLITNGSSLSAQKVVQRMVKNSLSVSDALSVAEFAELRGLKLDLRSYGVLIRKMVILDQPLVAEKIFKEILTRGIEPDTSIKSSMVSCWCKLGKLDEAMNHFDRLIEADYFPDTQACNNLLLHLSVNGMILDAFEYFVTICNAGGQLHFKSFEALIDGLCLRGYIDRALQVFEVLCYRSGCTPTLRLCKLLFYGLCKRGRAVEAESLITEMESRGMYIDKIMYTALIRAYCKDKKLKMALRVFYRMLKIGCEPDNYVFNTLIHGFVKINLDDKAQVILNQMAAWGLCRDEVTCQIMIRKYCKEQDVDCALMLLDSMASPSVHCYTTIICALYKLNDLKRINELCSRMQESGVVPDHILFLVLMRVYRGVSELQLATMMLLEIAMNGCGLDLSNLPPMDFTEKKIELLLEEIARIDLNLASTAFGIYVTALCKNGEIDEALRFMYKMLALGCKPLVFAYNSLIKCLCQHGCLEDANSLFNYFQDQGMVPDEETYLVIINELCKQGDCASALEFLNDMTLSGLRSNVAIYDTIIGRLFKEKRVVDAENIFKRMLESGVHPDEALYTTMINGYSKNGRALKACDLFEKMIKNSVQPSSTSYTALISGLVNERMFDAGCLYLDRMFGEDFLPNVVLYTTLMKQFLKSGDLSYAFRIVDLMYKSQIELDLVAYITLFSGVCKVMDDRCIWFHVTESAPKKLLNLLYQRSSLPKGRNIQITVDSPQQIRRFAMDMIQSIKKVSYMPNLYLYNAIISAFCKASRMSDAHSHFELMQGEGISPNHVTFTILIDGYIRSGDINGALTVFNRMNADGSAAPDTVLYNTLLQGLCMAGRLSDALSFSYAMRKKGFFPDVSSYEQLLESLCTRDLSVQAFRFLEEMVSQNHKPSHFSCNWVLCILCEQKRPEAGILLKRMVVKRPFDIMSLELLQETHWHTRLHVSSDKFNSRSFERRTHMAFK